MAERTTTMSGSASFRFVDRKDFHRRDIPLPSLITGADIEDKTPRTLLYGWTVMGVNTHVYLDETGEIVLMLDREKVVPYDNQDYVPSKRVMPEWLDRNFVWLLDRAGVMVTDTVYGDFPKTLFKPGAARERFE